MLRKVLVTEGLPLDPTAMSASIFRLSNAYLDSCGVHANPALKRNTEQGQAAVFMPNALLRAINRQAGVSKQQTKAIIGEHKSLLVVCMESAAAMC